MSYTRARGENRNPKHVYYVSLLNTKEWRKLCTEYKRNHINCERCRREGIEAGVLPNGYVRSAFACHHIKPVEGVGRYYKVGEELPDWVKEEMRRRCFDPNNLIALCQECHIKTHREMRSHQGQQVKTMPKVENDQTRSLQDWVSEVSGGKCEARPLVKKGIRRTKYGWLTDEEFKQRQAEELEQWKKKVHGLSNTQDTPSVDAGTED